MIQKSLYRSSDRMVADYLGLDRSMVRIATLIGIVFLGFSGWIYVVLWLIIPEQPGKK